MPKPIVNKASAVWNGDLFSGSGRTTLETSGLAGFDVNWKARSEGSSSVTTPEELLAGAHSACFSMALSNALADNGTAPESVDTTASITFKPGTGITGSHLNVSAVVPGLDAATFEKIANDAKANCPVSQALAGIEITLEATLA